MRIGEYFSYPLQSAPVDHEGRNGSLSDCYGCKCRTGCDIAHCSRKQVCCGSGIVSDSRGSTRWSGETARRRPDAWSHPQEIFFFGLLLAGIHVMFDLSAGH